MMSSPQRTRLIEDLYHQVRRFIADAILFNESVAARVGINSTDLQCLHLLVLRGPATPGTIARWCGLSTGGVTVVLDRLERAGYLRREPNPADRRSSIVHLVKRKLRTLEGIYRSKGENLIQLLGTYRDEELAVILDFFSKTAEPATDDTPDPGHP